MIQPHGVELDVDVVAGATVVVLAAVVVLTEVVVVVGAAVVVGAIVVVGSSVVVGAAVVVGASVVGAAAVVAGAAVDGVVGESPDVGLAGAVVGDGSVGSVAVTDGKLVGSVAVTDGSDAEIDGRLPLPTPLDPQAASVAAAPNASVPASVHTIRDRRRLIDTLSSPRHNGRGQVDATIRRTRLRFVTARG